MTSGYGLGDIRCQCEMPVRRKESPLIHKLPNLTQPLKLARARERMEKLIGTQDQQTLTGNVLEPGAGQQLQALLPGLLLTNRQQRCRLKHKKERLLLPHQTVGTRKSLGGFGISPQCMQHKAAHTVGGN